MNDLEKANKLLTIKCMKLTLALEEILDTVMPELWTELEPYGVPIEKLDMVDEQILKIMMEADA